MQRIGVLNGNNITYDHDLAGLVRWLTDWGVIQGGEVSGNKVQPVQAVIACQRSNGQKLMLYFESDEQVAIPSSGTFKVYIEVEQSKIDDGTGNAENGTGIASIKTWPTLPSQNTLLLASVEEWIVKDERNLIPKIQSVAQRTESLESKLTTAEGQISQLVEGGTPDRLEISWVVCSAISKDTIQTVGEKFKKLKMVFASWNSYQYYLGIKFFDWNWNLIPSSKIQSAPACYWKDNHSAPNWQAIYNNHTFTFTEIVDIASVEFTYWLNPWQYPNKYTLLQKNLDWWNIFEHFWGNSNIIRDINNKKDVIIFYDKIVREISSSATVYNLKSLTWMYNGFLSFWNSNDKKEIQIRRFANWLSLRNLKLLLRKKWDPTTNLVVQLKKWIKTSVSWVEKYIWGDEVLGEKEIQYSSITTEWKVFDIDFWSDVIVEKNTSIIICIKTKWWVVSSSNYYEIAHDISWIFDWFWCVFVWETNTFSSLIPYCESSWFLKFAFEEKTNWKEKLLDIWTVGVWVEKKLWVCGKVLIKYNTTVHHNYWLNVFIKNANWDIIDTKSYWTNQTVNAEYVIDWEFSELTLYIQGSYNSIKNCQVFLIQDDTNSLVSLWDYAVWDIWKFSYFGMIENEKIKELEKWKPIKIEKSITWNVSWAITVPSFWFLRVFCHIWANGRDTWWGCYVNWVNVAVYNQGYSWEWVSFAVLVPVNKWRVLLQTSQWRWNATMTVLWFYPL